MRLRELIREALGLNAEGLPDPLVRGVAQDSRRIEPGFVFVARRGAWQDGHTFIPEALRRGAIAIVGAADEAERRALDWPGLIPYLQVEDDKGALARLAAAFHGRPAERLTVVGVTGTDGKTTTATMLHWLLSAAYPCGLLSTAGCKIAEEAVKLPGHFTTPEAPEVQGLLARFLDAGCLYAVLESSSHGFAQRRLDEVSYDIGVLTNLSPEHLDYHGSFAAYRDAKAELFRRARRAVLNADDPSLAYFASQAEEVIRYAVDGGEAEWRALEVRAAAGRLEWRLVVETAEGRLEAPARLPMIGRYNVHNALAALAGAHALGLDLHLLVDRLASFPGVPGRMQVVQTEPFAVVVDFAHTAPALEKALAVLRAGAKRLIVVVGAAGERDPGKRAPLGEAAARCADFALFTEEDHRSESLELILARLAEGARGAGGEEGRTFLRVPDRREAIRQAVGMAREGDVVLLAGKGHEDSLERSGEVLEWDEVEEARRALAGVWAR
ncbi:MAG: UDP-N-acetylmuramoyl-L-alanyl-D-glutamate--2,6-diaminopimelate ligase [Deinococcota bacterium]|nr:UDP-N-acetylmuramoyl-L-alanyl-D-glutamate--2,6-diaminopimelate ligase [Deinococcota bacterium]